MDRVEIIMGNESCGHNIKVFGYKTALSISKKGSVLVMKGRLFLCGLGAVVLLAPGCSSDSDSKTGSAVPASCPVNGDQNPGIFGGTKVHPQSWVGRRVVAVLRKVSEDETDICTGALIDRNIVLTAGHCVDYFENAEKSKVIFTSDPVCEIKDRQNASVVRKVTAVKLHSKYNSRRNNDDLAMIRFEGVAPDGYQTVQLADHDLDLKPETEILLAGYGVSQDYNTQDNSDRHDLKFTKVTPFSGASERKQLKRMSVAPVMYFDQRQGHGACAGDSGGPAFTRDESGQFRVIGVASMVDPLDGQEFEKQSDVTCHAGIIYTSVLYYKDWIEKSFTDLKNSESVRQRVFEN